MLEAPSPVNAATIARRAASAEPLIAHALARARSSGWTGIHPCFCSKFKSGLGHERPAEAKCLSIERDLRALQYSSGVFARGTMLRHN